MFAVSLFVVMFVVMVGESWQEPAATVQSSRAGHDEREFNRADRADQLGKPSKYAQKKRRD